MLYVVLILVLAALAGVVTALITANSLWAWISIGVSVLAGIVLFVDWMRRRSAARTPQQAEESSDSTDDSAHDSAGGELADSPNSDEASKDPDNGTVPSAAEPKTAAPTATLPVSGVLGVADEPDTDDEAGSTESRTRVEAAPVEEETDAADLLIVSELDVEVVVVDEYPRYHLTDCAWLGDRDTIPIEVAEARELGFTPCARCGPDATLAAAHRRKGKSRANR